MKLLNLLSVLVCCACFSCTNNQLPYQNSKLSHDERARDLVSRLTLEEKISLMMDKSPAIPRLGIEKYNWWNEALHGVARAGRATVFPQTIGLAATFDDQAVYETYDIISDEARAKHHEAKRNGQFGQYQGLTFWTPNINIFRDPRWGRGMETYGEDPYLTTQMGLAVVRGLQGENDGKYDKAHACAKHYAVHSGPEWNRHSYNAENISQRDLWETYLPAFKAVVTEAGVKEVMCAYQRFEGEPCCSNKELLINLLRNEWRFDDVIVSDCGAIDDFFMPDRHQTHAGGAEASADAVLSGTDLECGSSYRYLIEAAQRGLINEEKIDEAVFRLLRARFELGMFDDDKDVSWASIPYSVVESEKHVNKALEMAQKSIVLLNNKNHTLPLDKNMKVAVVGPNANDSIMLWANYNGFPSKSITILEGIQNKVGAENVIYEKGCGFVSDNMFVSYFDKCQYKGQKGFHATFWNNVEMTGEAVSRVYFSEPLSFHTGGNTVYSPGVNLTNFSARFESEFIADASDDIIFKVSYDDGCRLIINGEEVISDWDTGWNRSREYTLAAQKGEKYNIVLEYFQAEGEAGLLFDFGAVKDVNYKATAEKVKDADVIIFVGGISPELEGEEMGVDFPGFHRGDRTNIELPEVQKNMLRALKATGKPVVFIVCSGSALAITEEDKNMDAILTAWYGGQQGGTAVADVLFGDYNPGGKLPITFFKSTNDLADFEDYNMSNGRTYRYFKGEPLYPFGYGLSYTTFEYGKANLSKEAISTNESVSVNIPVTNTGKVDGDEVVQIYIRNLQDPEGPIKSLRGYKRTHIKSGATETIHITLTPTAFEFFNPTNESVQIKPGNYEILYGGSSDEKNLQVLPITIQ